ncbi:MAG TPA: GntR family transcriptional regulator [Candidatus Methylomirabilis sp.]|nr:GntR family transcriptional regulator [Candidatus Methylomirabilis sp.]
MDCLSRDAAGALAQAAWPKGRNQLREQLSKGELKPRDQLPPERELAEKFQVSRAAVREAMRTPEFMTYMGNRCGDGACTVSTPENLPPPFSPRFTPARPSVRHPRYIRTHQGGGGPPLAFRRGRHVWRSLSGALSPSRATPREREARGKQPSHSVVRRLLPPNADSSWEEGAA